MNPDSTKVETEIRDEGLDEETSGDLYGDEWPEDGVDVLQPEDESEIYISVLEDGHGLAPGVYRVEAIDTEIEEVDDDYFDEETEASAQES